MNDFYEYSELYHHGIKGMRWGIRRYQNEDGTLTSAGKRRYGENLDINDKTRTNIAKIRVGEAKRRLDVAKSNNKTNYTRKADLQGRLRTAKRYEKLAKQIDKGAKLAAKGKTIKKEGTKALAVYGASVVASKGFTKFLNKRLTSLGNQGKLTPSHMKYSAMMNLGVAATASILSSAYSFKKASNQRKLRAYNEARSMGDTSIKRIGSEEYEAVVKRRSKK